MRRVSVFLFIAILTASLAPLSPATSTDSLRVDAGDSRVAYNGDPISLAGIVDGGVPPYAFAWSYPADPSRIQGTSFDTSGLAPQDIVLTLTVTDDVGSVASDTVRHRVDVSFSITRNVVLNFGVPDEVVGGAGVDQRPSRFILPAGLARIDAALSWADELGVYDVDFRLLDPSGNDRTGAAGATSANPERVSVDGPAAGSWTAQVEPFLNGPTTARLVVDGYPAAALPTLSAGGPYVLGRLDAQLLSATATSPADGIALAWDVDGDGFYETPGATLSTAFPAGIHAVRVRASDAAGFEVSAEAVVDVRAADTILRLRCGGDETTPYWAMEFTSSKGSCWVHGGHHTYFMGDARFGLRAVEGFVFTVEQQLSPPSEHQTDSVGATPLHLQVSEDGIEWEEVAHGEYRFLPDVTEGETAMSQRQRVDITAESDGRSFRYLRVHEPLSIAQGLSGYLDHSHFDVAADILAPPAAPVLVETFRLYSCTTDILEDFFLAHPCTFGGIDRWDAPSFWHTYPLGDGARIDTLVASFTLAPWRLDDWTQGDSLANGTNVTARVQLSLDGVHWDDVATVQAQFGEGAVVRVDLGSEPARFVRLFPEYHARFDQTEEFAPNHHPKGYFLESGLFVDGLLPAK